MTAPVRLSPEILRGLRPCGECRELVPAISGCKHWRPAGWTPAPKPARRKSVKTRPKEQTPEDAVAVNRFLAMMNQGKK